MKLSTPTSVRRQAFTLIEAVVVVGLLVVLILMLRPALTGTPVKAERIKCANNLKQVALAFKVFAHDNHGRFPFETPELTDRGLDRRAWTQFLALSNELGSAKILWCPGDKPWRSAATDFGWGKAAAPDSLVRMQDSAVSYIIGVGTRTNTHYAILLGDRNIAPAFGEQPFSSRGTNPFVTMTPKVVWSTNQPHHDLAGNIAMADGSVQQITESGLRTHLAQGVAEHGTNVNRFVFPQ